MMFQQSANDINLYEVIHLIYIMQGEYNIERLVARQRRVRAVVAATVWGEFVKWAHYIFESERHISFGRVGNYGYKIEQKSGKKIPFLFISEGFLKQKGLTCRYYSFVLKPIVKINFQAVHRHIEDTVTEEEVRYVVESVIEYIEQIVTGSQEQIKIDLDLMGHLQRNKNQFWFQYVLPVSPTIKDKLRQTGLRFHIEKEEKKMALTKLALVSGKQPMFPRIERRPSSKRDVELGSARKEFTMQPIPQQRPASKQKLSAREKGQELRKGRSLTKLVKLEQTQQNQPNTFMRTTRVNSFHKMESEVPDETMGWQMMGAGSDPLKKTQDFAKLTNNLKSLMETKFQFPKQTGSRSLPIIDVFARTLACPIATQRQNPLVAARVGSNLSAKAQRLYITKEGIKYMAGKSATLDQRKPRSKVVIMSDVEEYRLKMKEFHSEQQRQLLNLKEENYRRYIRLFNMIEDKNVFEVTPQQLVIILSQLDSKYEVNAPSRYNFKQIIDENIQEVKQLHIRAIKKAIIDYVLLDQAQMDRLNVYLRFKSPLFYGQRNPKYHAYDEQSLYKTNKTRIEEKLLKNSQNTLKIQWLWHEQYDSHGFIVLPGQLEPYTVIEQFWDRQKASINKFKQGITNQWIPVLADIYKQQITQLNRNQSKCAIFFQSTATQLHIQIRNLITRELQTYFSFIAQYDKKQLNPPDTVVFLQKTRNIYQQCFLNVRLSHRKDEIYFMDNMDEIENKLVDVIDLIMQAGRDIPRPENLITTTKKLYQMTVPLDHDDVYQSIKKEVGRIARVNIANTKACLQIYSKYAFLLNQMRVIDDWIYKGRHDRREYSLTFSKYRDLYNEVKLQVPAFIRMNMIYVDSSELKRYLLKSIDEVIMRLEKSVFDLVTKRNDEIQAQLSRMVTVATTSAHTCQKLVQIQMAVDGYKRAGIKKLQDQHNDLVKWISITLYNTLFPITDDDLLTIFETSEFLRDIYFKLDVAESRVFDDRRRLESQAKEDSKYFHSKLFQLVKEIESLKEFGSEILKDSALELIGSCRKKITDFKVQLKDLNKREGLLGIDQTDGSKLLEWDKNLKPFEQLWTLVKAYKTYQAFWTRESIFKQDSDFIVSQTKVMYKDIMLLSNNQVIRKIAPHSIKIAEDLADDIKTFQKNIPVIAVFSNPGLKFRHFQQISNTIHYQGDTLSASSHLYLNKVISLGAAEHIEELEVISETASKQYLIETTIMKINKEWKDAKLQMKPYKDTRMNILTGSSIEEIQALVDDHSLKVLTMKGSVYSVTFQKQIEELDEWLDYTNQLLDYSTKVQTVWMYLEPVMTSPDILKHLSVEGSKFRVVDEMWKEVTSTFSKLVFVKEIIKNKKIVPSLKQCHANLEVVQKGLNSYLESKRLNFPRFFFLSNEQLLQILSETKDPTRVQPHLKKCFQGIFRLQFEDNRLIQGMYSTQNEYVPFTSKINTALSRGNVDEWLIEVEEKMKGSIKREIKDSFEDYSRLTRRQCLLNRCAMSIYTVEMINWTASVQRYILSNELQECVRVTKNQLAQIVDLIKQVNLKPIHILTLESLIVLSVHNLDVTKHLSAGRIGEITDFSWESQLRYYYPFKQSENSQLTEVKILNTTCSFNHEYLGNTSRLVITPLTDRCYRTLCSAIFLNYGGAPEGPAGTGKTETVKDLAKALASQCVVFNCSDGLDYKAMGKFFKGLAASGAWSCFDQFNRINLEVLSVVAQQILCIQAAKAKKQKILFFQDVQLQLKESANCFITMNPGYAGRSQLPDNLKALFRSVAMMIPDYAMIAEISLYSYGFADARSLARKIVTTYKLCSEQLSSQEHYDYGMRAVKSVLVAAGNLKRKNQDLQESSLILKAINDVNMAKFLSFDIPLFVGITSDLFPSITSPQINYEHLLVEIASEYQQLKLSLNQYIIDKIIQIYDMILVRHGLMIVGYPFSGKSTALEVLARSLSKCREKMGENQVEICKINPKSITQKQLYGYFDEVSHEWFDGVLAVKFRNFASTDTPVRKWLLLDGPVDAVWIENMNTVLDDNKKLCLNSGEIISMSKSMSLIFEPMDLLAASPATVSRCGMIYLQPHSVGHEILIEAWKKRNDWLPEDLGKMLVQNFAMIGEIYACVKNLKTICFVSIFSLLQTFLKLLTVELLKIKRYSEQTPEEYAAIEEKYRMALISGMFIYAVVWSFGVAVDTPSRKVFDQSFKRIIVGDITVAKKKKTASFPDKLTLFDYLFRVPQNLSYEWVKWVSMIEENYPKDVKIHEIIVKTSDIVRYNHLLAFGIQNNVPVILCGPTGTGKTILVKDFYAFTANQKEYGFLEMVFSSRTTCTQVHEQIESKLDKRGSRHILGPKSAPKLIILVDDLNMPVKQVYGAQPPIELLRQLVDQQGFFDVKEKQKTFKKVIDLLFIYNMGASNNDITPRFLRHANLVSVTNFDEETLTRIFTTILMTSFQGHSEQKQVPTVLKYSIELYNECLKKLLPTPAKVHYIFNLRDLWKFVVGICRADKQKVHSENIGRLWAHEAKRIFMDRLLPTQKYIVTELISSIGKKWGKNTDTVYFSDILNPGQRSYEQIPDLEKVQLSVQTSLNNYNLVSDKPMDLVLFEYALKHILIILRIIRQPRNSALLVGLGGSGRKSFAQLASFIADYTPLSLQITKNYNYTQFREDVKKIFLQIGVKNKFISFLFSDTQIKDEQFLEDINNILNVGSIPNLFNSEERIQICEAVRKEAADSITGELTVDKLFSFFLARVKDQLKLIVCFSPIGESFRVRLRMFPSLVNCTTIDWFQQWPEEGLVSVASNFLARTELKNREAYIDMMKYMHSNIKTWSERLKQELNRYYYVTPTSYIEFILSFKQLLSQKRKENKQLIFKYENGCSKIVSTEDAVERMKGQLEEMKPQLKKAAEDTAVKMEMVKLQKEEADIIMSQISGEERVMLEAVNEANAIKQDCEKELAIALPQLKAAENALLVLDKNSLTELRTMLNPPIAVKYTMQGLCLLIDPVPKEKMKNEKTLKMQTDWWAASVRNLANQKLLNDLINFNKEGLAESVVVNLGKFLNDPNNKEILSVQNVANSSTACECIIQWVNGIYNFYFVNKKVKPKKESLRIAQEKVRGLNEKLDVKRRELDDANKKVEDLRYELDWAEKNKQRLEKEYTECEMSLKRASVIISSLGGEKVRWFELSEEFKREAEILDVNIFVASAQISYLGPFTQAFRQRILEEWMVQFNKTELKISDFSQLALARVLGKPIRVREWNMNGLPYDNFSVQNGIIMYNSRRWPLMIDPQGQCNQWLKKQEAKRKLKVLKTTDDSFIRNLQNCIQFGTPVLIQNLGTEITAVLTPVLLKQTYKKGATTYLKMGQNSLIYSHDFYLYMTTKLRNPHYLPQVCTQVVMINFMITGEGLTDQLLALLVSKERPDLQKEKEMLVVESAENQRTLKEIEDQILDILGNSQNILADETAINVLSASKSKAIEINEKQKLAEQTQLLIDKARHSYFQMASEGNLLFFAVSDLANIDSMYQYSLTYFTDLFKMGIENSERSENVEMRLANLRQYFRLSLFRNISRSLFQKDRLLFAALIALRLNSPKNDALRFLLFTTPATSKYTLEKPRDKWVSECMWKSICKLAEISPFQDIMADFNSKEKGLFQAIVSDSNPFSKPLPKKYEGLQFISKLMLYKCLRPEKIIEGFTIFVEEYLGVEFVRSLPFDLNKIYPDSSPQTPFLFILSPGADPFISVSNFSKVKDTSLQSVSLGQGQGAIAQKLIKANMQSGGWVVLQNCHLSVSWMTNLEKIVEQMQNGETSIHPYFRLWLTSYPSDTFPQSVLQKSLKMTNQPAKGLKNNLLVSFLSDPVSNQQFFEGCLYPQPFKKLIFSLCFFHALIQERRKYGPLGWNISYEFTESDLRISCRQLKIYIDNMTNDRLPFDALKYLIAECNYGGRVTDQNDRRLLISILDHFYNQRALQNDQFSFGNSDEYILPTQLKQHQQFLSYIDHLPNSGSPELVGLHPNANITKDINESNTLLETLQICCFQSGSSKVQGKSQDEEVIAIIQSIVNESSFPPQFNEELVLKKYPIKYDESMNTVLNQELGRYNRLLQQIKTTSQQLLAAIRGEVVMTASLERMYKALYDGKVPQLWLARSYPSLKSLASYASDLQKRCKFFKDWVDGGVPIAFWLSGFFFTQSFLTGILQNYSRRQKIPVDELAFQFLFKAGDIRNAKSGANIYGLFIEGASWDSKLQCLKQAEERELFASCPSIYFKPQRLSNITKSNTYETPLYKTQLRHGVLSTTGHSTNFVMLIKTPTLEEPSHWIKRGVAFLTQII